VIDCECEYVEVVVDQDINSISVLNCEDKGTDVDFIIPPDTTRRIGGWPRGIGFTGDEGFTSPISGGDSGRIINEYLSRALNINQASGRSKPGVTTQGSKSGGPSTTSSGCQCIPGTNGALTIKVCKIDGSANNGNSLNCADATQGAKLVVCGGRGPYTWSKTGDVELSDTGGGTINVTPPANSGSAVSGVAYGVDHFSCNACTGGGTGDDCASITHLRGIEYGCDDAQSACSAGINPCGSYTGTAADFDDCCPPTVCTAGDCDGVGAGGIVQGPCDKRTAQMIADGCNPCGVQSGATVSVTDDLGTVYTIILDV
jgi:hypothetical protein